MIEYVHLNLFWKGTPISIYSFLIKLYLIPLPFYFQAEMIPFANENGKNFTTDILYFGDAPAIAWKDITRVDYSDPDHPKPPHYRIYTGKVII